MSNEILDWSVIDYKSTVELLLQQQGSRFRGMVVEDSYHGKSGAAVNQIGAVTAQKRTTRHADTPLIETPHDRRWVFPSDYEWADLIDDADKLRTIADPTSPYAVNGAMSLGRAMDDLIITAATASSLTGLDFTTKPVLVDGRIKSFMGFNFVDSQRLALSGTDRTVVCWAKSGLHLGIWDDIDVQIDKRPDKSNSTQVYVKGTFGATRLEEEKVVAITCSEA